jgi:hypothetical protein
MKKEDSEVTTVPNKRKDSRSNTEASGRIERVMASVHASMAVEGLRPSKRCIVLGKQYLEGKIHGQEAIAKVKARHRISAGSPDD